MTTSIDELLAQAKPRRETVKLFLRGDLVAERDRLDAELRAERAGEDSLAGASSRVRDLAERVEALEEEMRRGEATFVVQAVGRKAWTDLLAKHPPTKEQRELFGRAIDNNPETFPAAAIVACLVEPTGVTGEQVARLEDTLSVGQWDELYLAVLRVNGGVDAPGESAAASAVLRRLRQNSEQPETMESVEASSLAAG